MKFLTSCLIGLIFLAHPVNGQVLLNEIQSSNTNVLADEFGDYPDWIELFNPSNDAINLRGWQISDDSLNTSKWIFPDYTLQPNAYLVLYASGRDLKQLPVYWNSIVDMGDSCVYFIPSENLQEDWKGLNFDDSTWLPGKTGIGYGDNDDSVLVPNSTLSVYLRLSFNLNDTSSIGALLLHIDYDDGFVAYLNGTEISRSNIGAPYSEIYYNTPADLDHEAVIYQGGTPEMFDVTEYKHLLVNGTNILAVEIHNLSNTSSDMTVIPFLTIGHKQYGADYKTSSILRLGNLSSHTNFKISSEGEPLILSDSNGVVIDRLPPVFIPVNVSYGNLANGSSKRYFEQPTPQSQNSSTGYELLFNDSVNFSPPGGFIQSTVSLDLSNTTGKTIYFTLDGSEPNFGSQVYSGPIAIDTTQFVRARIIEPGFLPGRVYAVSFLKSRKPALPVALLYTAEENLWDEQTGMYAMGLNASADFPYFGANFWNDWEYPFSYVYFDKNGNQVVSENVGAKIFGGWSRGQEQKSFSFQARKEYGSSALNYKFFDKSEITSFSSLVFRNSGNDWPNSMMRDAMMTGLVSGLNIDYQAYQPVVTYLNGEYWGVYNLREKVNEDFLAAHHQLNPDDIIILENGGDIVEGDNTEYLQLISYLDITPSLLSAENYYTVSDQIDVDNYIKYQLSQIYFANLDWPGNNIKFWKTTDTTSKWRWILYDTDFGFGLSSDASHNTLSFALDPYGPPWWPNPPWSTLLFRRLITNLEFRNNFINQLADNINTIFEPQHVSGYIDSIAGLISEEMMIHRPRWNQDYSNWQWNVESLMDFGNLRPDFMRDNVLQHFDLARTQIILLDVSDENAGNIRINSIIPQTYSFSGVYFEGVPVTVEALPKVGYKFVKWEGSNLSSDRILTLNLTQTTSLRAVFEQLGQEEVRLVINEINYKSSDDFDAGDWIEIFNPLDAALNISGYIVSTLNSDTSYAFPSGTILLPQGYIVVARDLKKFKEVYPGVLNGLGDLPFGLSSNGDEIRLYDEKQTILDAVDYLPYQPWPSQANGLGYTLELIDPVMDNAIAESWQSIKSKGTPGEQNSKDDPITTTFASSDKENFLVYPTKFSDYVSLTINLSENTPVIIDIMDIHGRTVFSTSESGLAAGSYIVDWMPNADLVSGIYRVSLRTNTKVYNQSIIYLKR